MDVVGVCELVAFIFSVKYEAEEEESKHQLEKEDGEEVSEISSMK